MTADAAPFWFDRAFATPSKVGDLDVAGASIHYEAWGENDRPGVVLVHGSNAHLEWWRFVAPFLADRLRVVALDSSGNGNSGWRELYSGAVFAEEVMAVADAAIAVPKPFVVGHSLRRLRCASGRSRPRRALERGGVRGLHRDAAGGALRVGRTGAQGGQEAASNAGLRLARCRPGSISPVAGAAGAASGGDGLDRPQLPAPGGGWLDVEVRSDAVRPSGMGGGQRDQFLAMPCRSAVIVGEESEDEGVLGASHMAEITQDRLPIVTMPGGHHHMMFEDPLALAVALKGILLSWLQEDG